VTRCGSAQIQKKKASAMEEKLSIEFNKLDLRRLIVPLVIEQLLSITLGLVDSLMVSRVGEAAISAVSLVDTVNVLLVNTFAALATGGAVIAGQYLGRHRSDKAGYSGQQLLLFMGEVSVGIMLLFYLGRGFILHVVFGDVAADVTAYANTYFLIVEASIPFLALYSAGAALFRVMGNSKVSMWIAALMNIINAVGNWALIFGLRMGVAGSAVSTLAARMVAAGLILMLLRRPELPIHIGKFSLHHDRYIIKNILRFGVPNGLESCMFQLGKILLLSTVAVLGTASVAANAISNTICSFQCVPGNALGLAIVTVVSRSVGAGSFDKARQYTKKLMKSAYLYMDGAIVLIAVLLPWILKLYSVSAEATEYARRIVLLHSLFGMLLWPASFSLPQALRAAGDIRFPLLVSTLSMWTVRVGLGILMVRCWGFGVEGIWLSMFADWLVRVIFFVPRFHGHRWETMGIRD